MVARFFCYAPGTVVSHEQPATPGQHFPLRAGAFPAILFIGEMERAALGKQVDRVCGLPDDTLFKRSIL